MDMSLRPLPLAIGLGVVLAFAGGAARAAPDITGMWQYDYSHPPAHPPVTPKAAAIIALHRAATEKGYVRELSNMKCLPTGMPQLMVWRSPIEIMESFGRISIITEHDPGPDEPRTIYLNEPVQPNDIDPSWNGHSIGHWDHDVLVVDTVGFNDRARLLGGVPRTEAAHITERFSLSADGQTLTDEMTMQDPQMLAGPWTVSLKFARMPNDSERLEAVCELDLDAIQKLDINAIKAFDIEAQRTSDPSLRYNPGGK